MNPKDPVLTFFINDFEKKHEIKLYNIYNRYFGEGYYTFSVDDKKYHIGYADGEKKYLTNIEGELKELFISIIEQYEKLYEKGKKIISCII
ncbi:MAG: hypothetical protein LBE36_01445 [Flavobacteriaceae bacterium]|jgi:hypothetical protein|nr:hypothetical protein [Flavobacteriaceae bacterium]